MNAIKIYIKVHVKYCIWYGVSMLIMPLTFQIGLLILLYFGLTNKDQSTAENLAHILFSVVSSLPLIIPNYRVSVEISKIYEQRHVLYFMLCQGTSVIIYYMFYKVYLYFFMLSNARI